MPDVFDPLVPTFVPWPKMPRLNRDIVITEKIDGTNAAVGILDDGTVYAQSRKRLITAEDDNFGFARWVESNANILRELLGPGLHFGEWWGQGIGRRYGMDRKFFSLFNTARWGALSGSATGLPEFVTDAPAYRGLQRIGVRKVPVLYEGPFSQDWIRFTLGLLQQDGSKAAPGFMDPEGVVIFHTAANSCFKVTIKDDEKPKGSNDVGAADNESRDR